MNTRVLQIVLPVIALSIGVVGAVMIVKARPEAPRQDPPEIVPLVDVIPAVRGTHTYFVQGQGTVSPRTESALVAEVPGRVLRISENFVEGGFFEPGEALLWLDDRDARAALASAQAQVAQARLTLERELEESRLAREEWERFGREGEPSALVLREPQLEQTRTALAAAEAQRDKAQRDLERTRVSAPYAGRVREKLVDVGDFLQPGARAALLYAVDYVEIRVPLFDEDLAFLDLPFARRGESIATRGPSAVIRGRFAGSVHEWRGTVHRTEGEVDARSRMVHVVVRVADPYGEAAAASVPLAVGMFVDVAIEGRRVENAVTLPRNVLLPDGRIGVVVEGRLRLRVPTVLRATREEIVLAAGVQDGEQVLLTRLDALVDGMSVRVAGEER
jgi:RND family efflux transporter MFP subunit